jgi:hypothetical protein
MSRWSTSTSVWDGLTLTGRGGRALRTAAGGLRVRVGFGDGPVRML